MFQGKVRVICIHLIIILSSTHVQYYTSVSLTLNPVLCIELLYYFRNVRHLSAELYFSATLVGNNCSTTNTRNRSSCNSPNDGFFRVPILSRIQNEQRKVKMFHDPYLGLKFGLITILELIKNSTQRHHMAK